MKKLMLGLSLAAFVFGAEDLSSALHGIVTNVDAAGKIITVKTKDGAVKTYKYSEQTTVHGAKEGISGIKQGSEVVVHYTKTGSQETAVEVDRIGKEAMHSTEGTVSKFDQKTKTLAIKTQDGTEHVYHLSARAASETGKDIEANTTKGAKVTVFYTEEAGKKVAHWFEKL